LPKDLVSRTKSIGLEILSCFPELMPKEFFAGAPWWIFLDLKGLTALSAPYHLGFRPDEGLPWRKGLFALNLVLKVFHRLFKAQGFICAFSF
jgi:hypothetical protein